MFVFFLTEWDECPFHGGTYSVIKRSTWSWSTWPPLFQIPLKYNFLPLLIQLEWHKNNYTNCTVLPGDENVFVPHNWRALNVELQECRPEPRFTLCHVSSLPSTGWTLRCVIRHSVPNTIFTTNSLHLSFSFSIQVPQLHSDATQMQTLHEGRF